MPARILILEDDEGLRFVLAQLLEGEGYEVETAARGEEAIQLASLRPFDLVVADIRMEGLDGLEALAGVRERQPGVRSLVVTGYSTEADSIRAIRLGVGDYLKKPFDLGDFLGSVARLLAERRQEQARREREKGLLGALSMALEGLGRSLDAVDASRGCLATARLAARLARQLGLAADSCQDVELAALLGATTEAGGPLFEESALPASLGRAVRHLEEAWDGSGGPDGLAGPAIPIESRVAAVALAAGRGRELIPGRYDPTVVEHLERPAEPPASPRVGGERRGLLTLGRALETAGDLSGARQAYQHALSPAAADRESLEALVALTRLTGDPAFARQALELAPGAGSGVAAATFLEAGILLGGDPEVLRQAGRLYQTLRLPAGEARALLALHVLGQVPVAAAQVEAALATLLQPEHAAELSVSAGWLLPFVLGRSGLERAAARLVRGHPQELQRQLAVGTLNVEQRRALAALEGLPPAVAQLLASDLDPEVRRALPSTPAAEAWPTLRLHSLGPFQAFRGDETVPDSAWRGPKNKYLLAYLATSGGRPVSEDVLIDLFWPDDVEMGRRSLYWATSVLRRCLRPAGAPAGFDAVLRMEVGLRLNPELPRWHDLEELQQAARRAASSRAEDALESHRRIVSLYRGPYLEGCYQDWVQPLRQAVEEQVTSSLAALMTSAQQRGRLQEVLEHAQRLLELDPCRQEAAIASMQALVALGRPEEAVRRYETINRTLRRELDLEPGIPLFEAYQRARLALP